MIESLFNPVISLNKPVPVSIPQVKPGTFIRIHVISELSGVVVEVSLRIQGENSHLDGLFV